MKIIVTPGVGKQEIWAIGNESKRILGNNKKEELVATIGRPILMTDFKAISKLPQNKMHAVFALYQSYPRITEFDGVSVWWDPGRHNDVWGPSIDTMVFADAMREHKVFGGVKSVAELGCGSGFLGKYAAMKSKAKTLLLMDVSRDAIRCAMDNVALPDIELYFAVHDKLENGKYDLVICNPPYVPLPSKNVNQYNGISLLKHTIDNMEEFTTKKGKVVINYSSVCEDMIQNTIESARNRGIKVELLAVKQAPFRVNAVINNKRWIDYLLKTKRLKARNKRGYKYWHTLHIMLLQRGENDG